jgi:hypothetical protein
MHLHGTEKIYDNFIQDLWLSVKTGEYLLPPSRLAKYEGGTESNEHINQ